MKLSTEQLNMLANAIYVLLTETESNEMSCNTKKQNRKGGKNNVDEHLGFHEDSD